MNNFTRPNKLPADTNTCPTWSSHASCQPQKNYTMEILAMILAVTLYAFATTIFFRKSFKRASLHIVLNMMVLGLYLTHQDSTFLKISAILTSLMAVIVPRRESIIAKRDIIWFTLNLMIMVMSIIYRDSILLMISAVLTCLLPVVVHQGDSIFKRKDLWSVSVFFPVYLDLQFDLAVAIFGSHGSLILTLIAACAQFIRKPEYLKAKLQKLRSLLGPIYVLYVSAICRQTQSQFYTETVLDHVMGVLSGVAMFSAIMASIVYRPDNSEILNFFINDTTRTYRKNNHKILMIVSFACFCFVNFNVLIGVTISAIILYSLCCRLI